MAAINARTGVIDNLLVKKIRFDNADGLKWIRTHKTYSLKSSGVSVFNSNPSGNYVAVADHPLTAGTDVDKFEYRVFSNSKLYVGIATANKTLNSILDNGEFVAALFDVVAGDKIIMIVHIAYLQIIHGANVKYVSFQHLENQTVYPIVVTVANNTLSTSIMLRDNLSIYINDSVPIFDTTKGIDKSHSIEFKTNGGGAIFDGNVIITGTLAGNVPDLIDDVTSSTTMTYSSDKIGALLFSASGIDDITTSTTTSYSSDKVNALITDIGHINDVTSLTNTYSSDKIDTLIAGIGGNGITPGASILTVASGQSITTASTIQYTLELAHPSLIGTLNTSLFSASTGSVTISNVNATANPIITFDALFGTANPAITLTYDNGAGASQMKNAFNVAFPSVAANNTVEVTAVVITLPVPATTSLLAHFDASNPSGYTLTGSDIDTIINLAPNPTADLLYLSGNSTAKATTGGNINGLNAFIFNSVSEYGGQAYTRGGTFDDQDYSVYLVYTPVSSAADQFVVINTGDATNPYGIAYTIGNGGAFNRKTWQVERNYVPVKGTATANVPEIICYTNDYDAGSPDTSLYVNDISAPGTYTGTNTPWHNWIGMGGFSNGFKFGGLIGEVLVYKHTAGFATSIHTEVFDYLKTKWGI